MNLLQCFSSDQVLTNHKENCISINGKQSIKMPEKGSKVKLIDDFEALTEKVYGCQPNNDKSYTQAYRKHTDCGYGYKVVCFYDDKYSKPIQVKMLSTN